MLHAHSHLLPYFYILDLHCLHALPQAVALRRDLSSN